MHASVSWPVASATLFQPIRVCLFGRQKSDGRKRRAPNRIVKVLLRVSIASGVGKLYYVGVADLEESSS
jgi:hypothetical protein